MMQLESADAPPAVDESCDFYGSMVSGKASGYGAKGGWKSPTGKKNKDSDIPDKYKLQEDLDKAKDAVPDKYRLDSPKSPVQPRSRSPLSKDRDQNKRGKSPNSPNVRGS